MNESILGEKLYEQLEIVKRYLIKMGASLQDAEDVVQDTAYKFLIYIDSMNIRHIEAWLFRAAVNQYLDLCRKRTRQRNILLRFNYEELFEEYTPEAAILQKELKTDISSLLNRLKPKYAEVLLLKYSADLKVTDIAVLYDMKANSVKTMLYRARKDFIKEFRRYEDEQRK